jgi:hypothetical protein
MVVSVALVVGIASYFISGYLLVHACGYAGDLGFAALDPGRNIRALPIIAYGSLGGAASACGLVIWFLARKLASRR